MEKCKICSKEFSAKKGLSYHLKITHKIDYYVYLCEHDKDFKKPVCVHCDKDINFSRDKHHSVHRYMNMVYCNNDCKLSSERYRDKMSVQGKKYGHLSTRGIPRSTETKQKISASVAEAYRNGFCFNRGQHTSDKTNKTYNYRSSWEKKYMIYLDGDPQTIYWEYEPFVIEYQWEGDNRRYLPDFIVYKSDGLKYIIEVGVNRYKIKGRDDAKAKAAEKYGKENGFEYQLVTEHDFCFIEMINELGDQNEINN